MYSVRKIRSQKIRPRPGGKRKNPGPAHRLRANQRSVVPPEFAPRGAHSRSVTGTGRRPISGPPLKGAFSGSAPGLAPSAPSLAPRRPDTLPSLCVCLFTLSPFSPAVNHLTALTGPIPPLWAEKRGQTARGRAERAWRERQRRKSGGGTQPSPPLFRRSRWAFSTRLI